jgi:formylglycine-generating enzyme required for sulfatase activity
MLACSCSLLTSPGRVGPRKHARDQRELERCQAVRGLALECHKKEYRLLTEAEWEYAARAGSNTRCAWGDQPGTGNANCNGCGGGWSLQAAVVGSFRPNAFGIHDMEGNVWEWVEDIWHDSYGGAPADGSAWLEGGDATYRVIRGGSWHNEIELIRAPIRFKRHRKVQFDTLGFRVARTMRP